MNVRQSQTSLFIFKKIMNIRQSQTSLFINNECTAKVKTSLFITNECTPELNFIINK